MDTVPANNRQLDENSTIDSLSLFMYDSLGRAFQFVKKYNHKPTPAEYELFQKEAYVAFDMASKTWYSFKNY